MNSNKHQYQLEFYKLLGLAFMILVMFGCGSLGLLFIRQQISETASATERIQRQITDTERRIGYLDTKIAEVHQPNYLHARMDALGLQLRAPRDSEVVYIQGPRIDVIPTPEDVEGGRLITDRDPFRHSIDMAVMEPLRGFN